jgi:hypothetical protein
VARRPATSARRSAGRVDSRGPPGAATLLRHAKRGAIGARRALAWPGKVSGDRRAGAACSSSFPSRLARGRCLVGGPVAAAFTGKKIFLVLGAIRSSFRPSVGSLGLVRAVKKVWRNSNLEELRVELLERQKPRALFELLWTKPTKQQELVSILLITR